MQRLQSKVAIVTASTRGIGFEIARRLCSEGASVVISSRKPDSVKAAVDILRKQGLAGIVEGTSCHVGNADDRQKLLDFTLSKFGRYRICARNALRRQSFLKNSPAVHRLDILVSNAAANPHFGPLHTPAPEAWAKIMDTNVTASLALAQCCLPHLTASKVHPALLRLTLASHPTHAFVCTAIFLPSSPKHIIFSHFCAGKHRFHLIDCRIYTIRRTRNVTPPADSFSPISSQFFTHSASHTPFCRNQIFRYNIRFDAPAPPRRSLINTRINIRINIRIPLISFP